MSYYVAEIEGLKVFWVPFAAKLVVNAVGELESHVRAQHGDLADISRALENVSAKAVRRPLTVASDGDIDRSVQMLYLALTGSDAGIDREIRDTARLLRCVPDGTPLAERWVGTWEIARFAVTRAHVVAEETLLRAHLEVLEALDQVSSFAGVATPDERWSLLHLHDVVAADLHALPHARPTDQSRATQTEEEVDG